MVNLLLLKKDKLEKVLSDDHVEYISNTAPSLEGGHDYTAWVENMFSR